MPGRAILLLLWTIGAAAGADLSGASALAYTREAVGFGPRAPGSEANHALQRYILSELRMRGCVVTEDNFTAQTPQGSIAMKNIVAKFPGRNGRAVAVTGHFDTKYFPRRKFVGADDGGSSTGLLLELARVLATEPHTDDVYLVFFDGEEAFGEWSATDSLYGSRHLAQKWRTDGTLARLQALINVDMIGNKNLHVNDETNSNPALRRLVKSAASDLGYAAYFSGPQIAEDDDHMPFVNAGAPAIDIIDMNYAPWHTDQDTMDQLSARSLEITGNVVLEVLRRIENQ